MTLPRPNDFEEFERVTLAALAQRWQSPNLQKNGRKGQKQAGVDIYGVDEIGDNCHPNLPFTGMSAGELYAHCGEPMSRRAASGYVVRRPAPGVERWRDLRSEDWVYDFGDGRLLREMHLRNGRVDSVESLSR